MRTHWCFFGWNRFLFLFSILFHIFFLAMASRFAVVRGFFAGDGAAQLAAFMGGERLGLKGLYWSLLLPRKSFRTGVGQQSQFATVCRSARYLRQSWSNSALSFFLMMTNV